MKKSLYEQPSLDVIDLQLDTAVLQDSNSLFGSANAAGLMDDESDENTYSY